MKGESGIPGKSIWEFEKANGNCCNTLQRNQVKEAYEPWWSREMAVELEAVAESEAEGQRKKK